MKTIAAMLLTGMMFAGTSGCAHKAAAKPAATTPAPAPAEPVSHPPPAQ